MKVKTIQKLATLELLLNPSLSFFIPCHEDSEDLKPFFWDSEIKGELTPLQLLKSNDWIEEIDPEDAIITWQLTEESAVASPDRQFCIEGDPENILLNEETKLNRQQKYEDILEIFKKSERGEKALKLQVNSDYNLSIILTKIDQNQWLCLSPLVPQETPSYISDDLHLSRIYISENKRKFTSDLEIQVKGIVEDLGITQLYGWYHGGYNNIHNYGLIYELGSTEEEAIERTLIRAGLIDIYQFKGFKLKSGHFLYSNPNFRDQWSDLNQFLTETFPKMQLYRFCFWDTEKIYILGETVAGDRAGIFMESQFTYNP